jgi:hypothetical protein
MRKWYHQGMKCYIVKLTTQRGTVTEYNPIPASSPSEAVRVVFAGRGLELPHVSLHQVSEDRCSTRTCSRTSGGLVALHWENAEVSGMLVQVWEE